MDNFAAGLMIALLLTTMVFTFSIRIGVSSAALDVAEQVCTVNDGVESLTVNTSSNMKVYCNNGAVFAVARRIKP